MCNTSFHFVTVLTFVAATARLASEMNAHIMAKKSCEVPKPSAAVLFISRRSLTEPKRTRDINQYGESAGEMFRAAIGTVFTSTLDVQRWTFASSSFES